MNRQWADQNRMLASAGPVWLMALGVLILLVFAVILVTGASAPATVSLLLLAAGIASLLAGLAWGARAPTHDREEF